MITARRLWGALCLAADILVPRFVDDECVLEDDGDEWLIVCLLNEVKPGERYDAIVTMRCFNLFGIALFPKQIGEPRPFVNPHDDGVAR